MKKTFATAALLGAFALSACGEKKAEAPANDTEMVVDEAMNAEGAAMDAGNAADAAANAADNATDAVEDRTIDDKAGGDK